MALQHARQGQVIDVQPYGAAIRDAQSIALFKSDQIEVMRLVFPAGHHMPTHKVPGEITIQCLEGRVDVDVAGRVTPLAAGQLLFVQGGVEHALSGIEASSVLVTIVL
ncbi:MAG: cupin domain-containing protein [Proteobacteria bacterium]|jgi:quercetin dioxygenase-like cupin family protein|nr:cupin domain-containing protein [Pseudomonadota bacterium]